MSTKIVHQTTIYKLVVGFAVFAIFIGLSNHGLINFALAEVGDENWKKPRKIVNEVSTKQQENEHVQKDEKAENIIKPVYLGFKFHTSPIICIFGTDTHTSVGLNSVLDWQNKLIIFTDNKNGWGITTLVNPLENSRCSTEIHFLKEPHDELIRSIKSQGITYFEEGKAFVEVYTTQYYDSTAFLYINDQSGKTRPVIGEFAEVPIDLLEKVTKHELGHVFGLKHQKENSIMITGPVLAEITDKDCEEVIKNYGAGWA